jgi:hypothetical protein
MVVIWHQTVRHERNWITLSSALDEAEKIDVIPLQEENLLMIDTSVVQVIEMVG